MKVWIAENRGKNRNGYELVILSKREVWLKTISKKDVKRLKELGVKIRDICEECIMRVSVKDQYGREVNYDTYTEKEDGI